MERYTDFEVWIDLPATSPNPGNPSAYPVRVTISPAGPATGRLDLNLGEQDFQNKLSVVRDMGPDLASRQAFGQWLFEALFRDQVRDTWKTSRGRVDAGEADGLRLRLWINDPQLAVLPWELMYEEGKGFLATAANLALSRYLPVLEPPTLTMQEKLRILIVVESPSNLPQINIQEVAKLEDALIGLGGAVEYTALRNPATPHIHNALQQGYHILHFLGHGRAGKLALTEENGTEAAYITDQEFAQLVQGRPALRLIVLNACYSSQPTEGTLFAGMGPSLVQMQIPAVIAMQYNTVSVDTAGQFSKAFYGAMAKGIPVDFAVNEARQQISAGALLQHRDWSTPVLYMGTRRGRLLHLPQQADNSVDQAWQSLGLAVQASEKQKAEQGQAAMTELTQRFREVANRQQEMSDLRHLAARVSAVRDGFEPCHSIVREAAYDMEKLFTQFGQLQSLWIQMRHNQWAQLITFVALHPALDVSPWYQPLENQVTAIDSDFAGTNIGSLRNRLNACAGQLRQAEIQVRFQLDQTIDDLMRVSDRTLGRLAAF